LLAYWLASFPKRSGFWRWLDRPWYCPAYSRISDLHFAIFSDMSLGCKISWLKKVGFCVYDIWM
jgi:hypothetical protein